MRHSINDRFLGSTTYRLHFFDKRGVHALLSTLLTGCLSGILGQSAMSQTPAAPVHSVLKDTAFQSSDVEAAVAQRGKTERTYMALASGLGSVSNTSFDAGIQLGPSDEGTIISMTQGEDRITSQVPAGTIESINLNQYASPEYSQIPSSYMSGGSYSGYASQSGLSSGNPCCPENCHSYYAGYEALYIQRKADEAFTLSRGNRLGGYDYEFGNRITLGQMLDCTDGVELVYTGPLKWTRSRIDQSNTGSLNTVFTPSGGYLASQIDTYNGAIRHIQVQQSELQSYEANRRWFVLDVMSTLIGLRAIQLDGSFLFDSVAPDLGAGFFRTRSKNFLVGAQCGADIYRPIGQRLSVGSRSRIGFFANFHEGETVLANRGTYLLFASDKSVGAAAMIQYAVSARYRILPHVAAVGGYEAWVLTRVQSDSDRDYSTINPNTGVSYSAKDTVIFHGATGGLEITW